MRLPIPREAAFQILIDEQPPEGPYFRGSDYTAAVSLHQQNWSPHSNYAVQPPGPPESGVGSSKDIASFSAGLLHL